ncbi:uncharacterized protein FTOL_04173 [Fusarium torulosum]|uniref:Uncharacterized protein n=1 Tax=Fusarium torulosum TaxID=33205 RepID=A0AAE8M5C3_9HYPO|nr:uncharacterized protein FTOL_04173 [Fusarium torulosum]
MGAPNAYFLNLSRIPRLRIRNWVTELRQGKGSNQDNESDQTDASAKPVYPSRMALQLTCFRSRQAVEIASRSWMPTIPFRIPEKSRLHTAMYSVAGFMAFHDRTKRQYAPARVVDTSCDLVILHDPLLGRGHSINKVIPEIKYLAMPYRPGDCGKIKGGSGRCLADCVLAFPELRVLYILVHPDAVNKQVPNEHYIQNYYNACQETQAVVPSKTFLFRDRIYYEMPWKLHRDLIGPGELDLLLYVLCSSARRQRNDTGPKLAIRVMTWEYAPGVRARFDTR